MDIDMQLSELKFVATLGVGAFGRVNLVTHANDVYAMKCLKKMDINSCDQRHRIDNECKILEQCNSPFICHLHKTLQDSRCTYLLMEPCLGGEVFSFLRRNGGLPEYNAQFISACVIEALEFLHARNIVYRDLKPENLMFDSNGYVKMVDFGIAKYLNPNTKSYTLCGTSEYMAPEAILKKGYDYGVDYWALGILIYDLLNSTAPFIADSPEKTYDLILKGIDEVCFPIDMPECAVDLIKNLCCPEPLHRLGYQKNGMKDIKNHWWYFEFDWKSLQALSLKSPFELPLSSPTDTKYFENYSEEAEAWEKY